MKSFGSLRTRLKSFLQPPVLERMVPTFYSDFSFTTSKTLSPREQQKMHAEQMSMLAAQIDEQRLANQYNLMLVNRTLIVAITGTLISAAGIVVAIFALVISAHNG